MNRRSWAVWAALAALVVASGCKIDEVESARSGMEGGLDGAAQAAGVDGLAEAAAPLDPTLPESAEPDRASVFRAYQWIRESFGSSAEGSTPNYVFDPAQLQEIANMGAGLPLAERWEVMRQELERRYPGKIAKQLHWTFQTAGNLVCQIAMVYASPVEYVGFFGTPIGANGFSGRYNQADVWDLMVDGEMWTYVPGQFDRTVHHGGETAYLPKGTGKGVAYVDHAWMIDYGRGNIITMFPFGVIAPAMFTTLDYRSALEQFGDYAKLVIQNLQNP